MNWHHWYWWTWPAGIAIGLLWTFVFMHLIPPRYPLPHRVSIRVPRWLYRILIAAGAQDGANTAETPRSQS